MNTYQEARGSCREREREREGKKETPGETEEGGRLREDQHTILDNLLEGLRVDRKTVGQKTVLRIETENQIATAPLPAAQSLISKQRPLAHCNIYLRF